MGLLVRVIAVFVAALLYALVFAFVALVTLGHATNDLAGVSSSGSAEFFTALDRASDDRAAEGCGYRTAKPGQEIRLSTTRSFASRAASNGADT